MVSKEKVHQRLNELHFNLKGWGRTEANELPRILMPDETIYDLVNGVYEGGFALLVATDMRILLVDKKPLNYLTVEDLRFDMISEIDYSHRLIGANVSVSTGSKNLQFMSLNQQRLRKLTTHVQHRMAELKKRANEHREDQKGHLEQINQQLQAYLLAQHQQQRQMNRALRGGGTRQVIDVDPIQQDNRVADYLYAQSLLSQNPRTRDQADMQALQLATGGVSAPQPNPSLAQEAVTHQQQEMTNDLYNEGLQEIYGAAQQSQSAHRPASLDVLGFEIHPLDIAYGKLPLALWDKFRRPAFHKAAEQPIATR